MTSKSTKHKTIADVKPQGDAEEALHTGMQHMDALAASGRDITQAQLKTLRGVLAPGLGLTESPDDDPEHDPLLQEVLDTMPESKPARSRH